MSTEALPIGICNHQPDFSALSGKDIKVGTMESKLPLSLAVCSILSLDVVRRQDQVTAFPRRIAAIGK